MRGRRLVADAALVGVTAVWGTTFVVVKDAVEQVSPLTFVSLRFAVGLAVLALLRPRQLGALRPSGAGLLLGVVLGGGFLLQTLGLQLTTAAKGGFITGLNVALVPFCAFWLLRQAPGPNALVGVTLATVGLGLLSLTGDLSAGLGDLLVLGCAVGFALHIALTAKLAPSWPAVGLVGQQLGTIALAAGLGAVALERPAVPSPSVIAAIMYTGAIATALAFVIQTWAQRFTPPTHVGLIYALEPAFAAFFAWLWRGEALTGRVLFGGALILLGVVVAELPPLSLIRLTSMRRARMKR